MHGGSRGHAPCIPGKRRGRAFMEGVGTMHSRTVVHFRAVVHGRKISGVMHAQRVAGRACKEGEGYVHSHRENGSFMAKGLAGSCIRVLYAWRVVGRPCKEGGGSCIHGERSARSFTEGSGTCIPGERRGRAWPKDQWVNVCKMEGGGAVHARRNKGTLYSWRLMSRA
jgi:hypothetical protein